MKLPFVMAAAIAMAAPTEAQQGAPPQQRVRVAPPIVQEVAPALADYTDDVLFGDLWKRPDLAPRDRSMVTIAALVAGGHAGQMTGHFNRGLDNGVKPGEIAAIITHLAFYAGWPRAISAVGVAKEVFTHRGIGPDQLKPVPGDLLPIDEAAEAQRAAGVEAQFGAVTPGLVRYTNTVLFGDLWRRADLAPRDRSLVTITALIAAGQVDQLAFHMTRGMQNGLTQAQLAEIITHLAFYAGWPRAMSALPVAKAVFEAHAADAAAKAAPGKPDTGLPGKPGAVKPILDIQRHGALPPTPGAADHFTGSVRVEGRFQRDNPARVSGGSVSFEPGARTAWHSHPLGQTLIVTAGCGWVQREGGDIETIRPGDTVWIPSGVRHWHGASATAAMTHIAITEVMGGKTVDWMEQVPEPDYRQGPRGPNPC